MAHADDIRLPRVTGPWRALLVALLLAIALAGILTAYFHQDLTRRAETAAREDLNRILAMNYEALAPLSVPSRNAWLRDTVAAPDANTTAIVLLVEADGQVVGGAHGQGEAPRQLGEDEFTLQSTDGPVQLVGRYLPLSEGQRLFVGVRLAPYLDTVGRAMESIWLTALALFVPFGLLTLYWQRQLRNRLRKMIAGAERIGDGDMTVRFAVRRNGDEFDAIAAHMNMMVERLKNLKEAVERQSDHIRHEFLQSAGRIALSVGRLREDCTDEGALYAIDREQRGLISSTTAILHLSRARSELLVREVVDLMTVAEDVLVMMEGSAELREQNLYWTLEPAPCLGDKDMLRMAFGNLVSNAIKYTPEGGEIEVSTIIEGEHARFRVRDSGPGVPLAMRDTIFEPGRRGDVADVPGHGYGLAIARAVARQHNGRLWVEDGPSRGACFVVELPLHRP